ncbi:YicC/YloC family endoribonuclease [Planctomyces sp. SH-PL62]|uniref:YicC/YloC family endoribonuclease n=1 Tax=Planctomyces sp. SH-PL62 TaxID=1636152 RepID=UPI00078B460C|nr:YicC/YloC family endoribonuclease [Planctomyces sp. SH-PL62]AMV40311.1 hypothetical protein VT85_22965 [Planctomyces sp. SH-PL62]
MLLSMTGFGEARAQDATLSVAAEVRAVNNRHLKITAKVTDPYGSLEPELEQLVRERVRRGAVQVSIRIDRPRKTGDYQLNATALTGYRDQLQSLDGAPVALVSLLGLPGIIEELKPAAPDVAADWPVIARVAAEALANFEAARAREGAAMAAELLAQSRAIREALAQVGDRAPLLVQAYQKRLTERVQALVQEHGVAVEAKDLIREIAILADRSDVSEELVRMRAHLDQYEEIVDAPESGGRKLEFVVQEMGREVNTVGSKSNDVEISRLVVEIKASLERIRELVQNVE